MHYHLIITLLILPIEHTTFYIVNQGINYFMHILVNILHTLRFNIQMLNKPNLVFLTFINLKNKK
jgi:hypothetical protein